MRLFSPFLSANGDSVPRFGSQIQFNSQTGQFESCIYLVYVMSRMGNTVYAVPYPSLHAKKGCRESRACCCVLDRAWAVRAVRFGPMLHQASSTVPIANRCRFLL